MAALALSAILKLVDLPSFENVLTSWRTVPGWAQRPVALIVPGTELLIAGAWFLVPAAGRVARAAGIAVLLIWTGAYLAETVLWGAPKCGCLGQLRDFFLLRQELPWLLGRNSLLIVLLSVGADLAFSPKERSSLTPLRRSETRNSGFTLIELVMVITLVALLAALLVSALSPVRLRAKSARALAELRTHAQTAAAYAGDFKDSFICTLNPAFTHTIITVPGQDVRVSLGYFDQRWWWWAGVADNYYNGVSPTFFAPSRSDKGRGRTYNYTVSGLAAPEFWNLETRSPRGQIRPMALADVLFPSRKGLFISFEGNTVDDMVGHQYNDPEASLCDGSARVFRSGAIIPPIGDGEGPYDWPYTVSGLGHVVVHTRDGVRGADLR